MKKQDVSELKTVTITEQVTKIPEGWEIIKEPTKITENNLDVFKIVIGRQVKSPSNSSLSKSK